MVNIRKNFLKYLICMSRIIISVFPIPREAQSGCVWGGKEGTEGSNSTQRLCEGTGAWSLSPRKDVSSLSADNIGCTPPSPKQASSLQPCEAALGGAEHHRDTTHGRPASEQRRWAAPAKHPACHTHPRSRSQQPSLLQCGVWAGGFIFVI